MARWLLGMRALLVGVWGSATGWVLDAPLCVSSLRPPLAASAFSESMRVALCVHFECGIAVDWKLGGSAEGHRTGTESGVTAREGRRRGR